METKDIKNNNKQESIKDPNAEIPKSKRFRKDKPWDNDPTIDKFKIEEFKKGDMKTSLLEESSFAVLFPQYREKYIKEVFPHSTVLRERAKQDLRPHDTDPFPRIKGRMNAILLFQRRLHLPDDKRCRLLIVLCGQQKRQKILVHPDRIRKYSQQTILFINDHPVKYAGQMAGTEIEYIPEAEFSLYCIVTLQMGYSVFLLLYLYPRRYDNIHAAAFLGLVKYRLWADALTFIYPYPRHAP